MTAEKGGRKDKNQNIQVFVRLRPLNQREKDIKSLGVVEVVNNREVLVRQSHQTSITKKFTFDKAFGPNAKQVEVYQDVVSPLIAEVLAGYNCTVFAYGQTGTGKTHTMIGENTEEGSTWQNDPLAGIIPRALSQIFDELRLSNTEYTVRVSYLELYNEELFDLLSSSEDNSKLRIYEDVTRKGSNIVNGLEEITVYNKNEVYKIMAQGQDRKKVACTLMNAQSSRSHTVFTILIHMKENSPEGEELVKIGKLNLVDLAGSENISKAGSDNPAKKERARECVNINQSLLTLGRVITALVERHPHIPYRESKLTRILQESLGGRTKTSIIATISPGHKDLEETMSTLDYANRAKNIQNKPEVNQKMTKKAILKEYSENIDRLKRDLQAARDKNGIYLANETYTELTLKQEEQRKEIQELILQQRALEERREVTERLFTEAREEIARQQTEIEDREERLQSARKKLGAASRKLQATSTALSEQAHLVRRHAEVETRLSEQASRLLDVADTATRHVDTLHDVVDKRRTVESTNLEVTATYRAESLQLREQIRSGVDQFMSRLVHALASFNTITESHSMESKQVQEQNKCKIDDLIQTMIESVEQIKALTTSTNAHTQQQTSTAQAHIRRCVTSHAEVLRHQLERLRESAERGESRAAAAAEGGRGTVEAYLEEWSKGSQARVTSLREAQARFVTSHRQSERERLQAATRQSETRIASSARRNEKLQALIEDLTQERQVIQERTDKQLLSIERDRQESLTRLETWAEQERKNFEERLAKCVSEQREELERRLESRREEIQVEKREADERMARRMQLQEEHLSLCAAEQQDVTVVQQHHASAARDAERHVLEFTAQFDEGAAAVSAELQSVSRSLLLLLDHLNVQLMEAVGDMRREVESGVSEVVTADAESTNKFTEDTESAITQLADNTTEAVNTVLDHVEKNTTATLTHLRHLSTNTSSLLSAERSRVSDIRGNEERAVTAAQEYRNLLHDQVDKNAQLEGRYLAREYVVYSPTGKTPVRQQFRYPRQLAATSPHQRILARFRAMKENQEDEDCIVIEDADKTPSISDSESSLSEDSSVFAAPSPPAPAPAPEPAHKGNNLVKCSSETNVYCMRKNGKENERSVQSHQKPSKLPAPQSHKKPLCDRNNS